MPFYVVALQNNVASITHDWNVVQVMSQIMSDYGYSKMFETKIEAEKYIKDQKFKFMSLDTGTIPSEHENKQPEDADEHTKQVKSTIKNHIKKIKMAFNDLQIAISSIPEFSSTCPEQIQTLNDKVAFKLSEILKIKKIENQGNDLPSDKKRAPGESQESSKESQPSTSSSSSKVTTDNVLTPELKEEAKKMFSYNNDNEVIVYCKGSHLNNGNSDVSAWFGRNHFLNMAAKLPGLETNICAEIYSIVHALERVKSTGVTKINIRTTSQFVIITANEWIQKWKVDGWKTAGGSEIKNKQLFVVMLQSIESMDSCTWTLVPGHKYATGNEEANKLAKAVTKM